MRSEEFTQAPDVLEIVREIQDRKTRYSDIVDDAGHQYVDIVLEGGGMLGLALGGYIHVLEQAGLRFAGIGGTSAGSVTPRHHQHRRPAPAHDHLSGRPAYAHR